MVTPFAWSQPHPVNDHVAGAAEELRRRGHEVVVLAPSSRATDLAAGRRALKRLGREGTPLEGVVALGPSVPVSRRSRLGVPIGVQANLGLALTRDRFDVVHVHEPGLPSLSYLALRDARGLAVATFHSADRLGYPPGKKQRERLLGRVDALTATSQATAEAAAARFPGDYRTLPLGVDLELLRAGDARAVASSSSGGPRSCRGSAPSSARWPSCPAGSWSSCGRSRSAGRPYVPRALRGRVDGPDCARRAVRAPQSSRARPASSPRLRGSARLALEARAAGVPLVDPPGSHDQPDLVGAALARLAEDEGWRTRRVGGGAPLVPSARASASWPTSSSASTAPFSASGGPPRAGRRPARRPADDPRRPAHAHRALPRLLGPGRATSSTTPSGSASAPSRSPTTTSSRAPQEAVELARDARRSS